MISYLSPTSIRLWRSNRDDFYRRYILPINHPNHLGYDVQNRAMAIGAGFDALLKLKLSKNLFSEGKIGEEDRIDDNIFDNQVEPENRKWCLGEAEWLLGEYISLGAYQNLYNELLKDSEIRFEFKLERECFGVLLSGRPDIRSLTKSGRFYVRDIKVNGYQSKTKISPTKGYVNLIGRKSGLGFNFGSYKDVFVKLIDDHPINYSMNLEDVSEDWALQLVIYSWLNGAIRTLPIEGVAFQPFLVGIEQIVGSKEFGIKVATHCYIVQLNYQRELVKEIIEIWERIKLGEIFDEDNKERKELLEKVNKVEESEIDFMTKFTRER